MYELNKSFENSDQKKLERLKKEKNFWFRTKAKALGKYMTFKLKMSEIWSFVKHEFLTVRKLIFLINDQFFGREYKNRKIFYHEKDKFIKNNGYAHGEVKFNSLVRNITKGVDLNKRLLKAHG